MLVTGVVLVGCLLILKGLKGVHSWGVVLISKYKRREKGSKVLSYSISSLCVCSSFFLLNGKELMSISVFFFFMIIGVEKLIFFLSLYPCFFCFFSF